MDFFPPRLPIILLLFFFLRLYHLACRILVPQPGTEVVPPALGAWTLNHWTTGQVPIVLFKRKDLSKFSFWEYMSMRSLDKYIKIDV